MAGSKSSAGFNPRDGNMLRAMRKSNRDFGLPNTIKHYVIAAVNKITFFRVYRVVMINQVHPEWMHLDPNYTCRFLEPHEIMGLARTGGNELSEDFVTTALAKGDRCFAILDGAALVSYMWYSSVATQMSCHLQISFAPEFVYSYHAYTLDAYRGLRLTAVRITRGLDAYLRQGKKGVVFYVEADNYPSLRAISHVKGHGFGWIAAGKLFGRYVVCHSPGCKKYGLTIKPI